MPPYDRDLAPKGVNGDIVRLISIKYSTLQNWYPMVPTVEAASTTS